MTSNPALSDRRYPLPNPGLASMARNYDLILCDVWGVVHNGVTFHAAAVDALQRFRRGGGTVVLVTNAPAPAKNVVQRMDSLGVPHDIFDAIATSGDVTAAMIAEAGCPPVYHIGPPGELDVYAKAGTLGDHKPVLVPIGAARLVVAIGLSTGGGARPEDYDTSLEHMRSQELVMICANPDIVVEVGDHLEYCAGAIAERYERLGGTVVQAGKPFAAIYERALSLAKEKLGQDTPRHRILAIGDAMHTDMQGAHNQGIDALFITSGIHRAELHGSGRNAPLDQAALRQFLGSRAIQPQAVMGSLAW